MMSTRLDAISYRSFTSQSQQCARGIRRASVLSQYKAQERGSIQCCKSTNKASLAAQRHVRHLTRYQQQLERLSQGMPGMKSESLDPDVLDWDIKIIGLGQRGVSATTRLMGNWNMHRAEAWVLDTDLQVLNSSSIGNKLLIPVQEGAQLPKSQLAQLAGAASLAAAADRASQRPGSPVATCGVVFLLGGAGAVPGGSAILLQLASYLRQVGFFVVAALTKPFEFEGRRKVDEADALIQALQDVAQLVVAVAQDDLMRTSAELTINDASAIAINTLEVSCRAVLWALGTPEILRASAGTMLWHGRDLRQYKRLLSPPLEVLLTCPGVGSLGRGLASLPLLSLSAAGLASGLSMLAEDAVGAACESPFLQHVMPQACGVLCVLSLPATGLSHNAKVSTQGALNDPEKYAIRAAVQVAAATVVELAGRQCQEVVVCAHVRPDWPYNDPSQLCLEATVIVLEDPLAAEAKKAAASSSSKLRSKSGVSAAASRSGSPQYMAEPTQEQQQMLQLQRASQVQEQQPLSRSGSPAAGTGISLWTAMTAVAGGSAAAAVGQYKKMSSQTPGSSTCAGTATQHEPPGTYHISTLLKAASRLQNRVSSANSSRPASTGGGSTSSSRSSSGATSPCDDKPLSSQQSGSVHGALTLLPSSARQYQHRHNQEQQPQARGVRSLLAALSWSTGSSSTATADGVDEVCVDTDGASKAPTDVKSRVAGMLLRDRSAGWTLERG